MKHTKLPPITTECDRCSCKVAVSDAKEIVCSIGARGQTAVWAAKIYKFCDSCSEHRDLTRWLALNFHCHVFNTSEGP